MRQTNEQLVADHQSGDADALGRLVVRNEAMIRRLVFPFRKRCIWTGIDDLLQVGRMAVCHAADNFDATRGTKFTTLAWIYIINSVSNELKANTGIIHVPRNRSTKHDKQKLICGYVARLGWGCKAELEVCGADDVFRNVSEAERRPLVAAAIGELPERLATVLARRLDGDTLLEIGDDMSLSKERVRQLETRAKAEFAVLFRRVAARMNRR